jgi:mycofactocin system glycosyltransferase
VTVVIPVRDDAPGLAATLARLGPVEHVLVVDDGSADPAAVRRAAAAGPQDGRTQVLRLDVSRGPGGARQMGWQAAPTEVVAFVDAGCTCEPGWLGPLTAHLADPAVAAVAPRIRSLVAQGTAAWLGAYEEVRSPLDLGPAPAAVRPRSPVPYVPTAALVVRRAALDAVGGFDPVLRRGEDVDLVWRLAAAGWVVRYEPVVRVGHAGRPTLGALLRQRYDYGTSAGPLAARHGDAVAPLSASAWSAAAWGLAGLGHPVMGAGVAAASTAALVPRLRTLRHPGTEALRLAGGGHLRTGRLIAEAMRRSWWPLLGMACLGSRPARRLALLAAVGPPVLERRPAPRAVPLPAWLALRLAEDLAYGLGVWAGAARCRSTAALRPHLMGRPGRSTP